MTFEILSSQILLDRSPLSYIAHQLRLPDGAIIEKDVIGHPGAVAIVPLRDDGNVVLVRQYRVAARRYMLEIPAGTLEPPEEPEACARRELQEEAGYLPETLEALGGFYLGPGLYQEYIHLFLAKDLRASRLPGDADEFIEVVEMPLVDAVGGIMAGEIVDAKTIIGLLRIMIVSSR